MIRAEPAGFRLVCEHHGIVVIDLHWWVALPHQASTFLRLSVQLKAWVLEPGGSSSNPSSITYRLCDLAQVTVSILFNSTSLKWDS